MLIIQIPLIIVINVIFYSRVYIDKKTPDQTDNNSQEVHDLFIEMTSNHRH